MLCRIGLMNVKIHLKNVLSPTLSFTHFSPQLEITVLSDDSAYGTVTVTYHK